MELIPGVEPVDPDTPLCRACGSKNVAPDEVFEGWVRCKDCDVSAMPDFVE